MKRLIKRAAILLTAILLIPISVLMYALGYRRLAFFTDRIGHLAIEPDTILKAQHLGLLKPKRWIVLAPRHRVSNQHLLSYWMPHFAVIQSAPLCFLFECLTIWPFVKHDTSYLINNSKGSQYAYEVNALWQNREPVLTLTDADKKHAAEQLEKLGLPSGAWFACVHAREGGFSPVDETIHSHRNGHIDNLIPSINEITKNGGWVIRLGDPTMRPLKPMPQVIDYAHHELRSQRLDIILCAQARFILGNTSGLFLVSTAFGVPSALVNMIPMPTLGFLPGDIAIPKLLRCKKSDRYFTFNEVMKSDISTYRYAALYEKNNVDVVENTADDILAVTQEMLQMLDKAYIESAADQALRNCFLTLLEPKHYCYKAKTRVSIAFLRKYQHLLKEAII